MKFPPRPPSDPVRLGSQNAELKRALVALADLEGPSSPQLQRMRQRLTTVFDSPAPRHAPLLRLARSSGGRVLAGVMVLTAAIGGLRVGQPRAAVEDMPGIPAQHQAASPADAVGAQRVQGKLPESAALTHQAEPGLSLPSYTPRPVPRSVRPATRPHRAHTHAPAPTPSAAAEGGVFSTAATGSPDSASPSSAAATPLSSMQASSAAASQRPRTPNPSAAPDRQTKARSSAAVSAPLDEAGLLQRARQLASSAPDTSLRLLDEHKRRFANGMLSPEREVLAIELLRSLSRDAEAAERLQAFRRSDPRSVYLDRLEH